MQMFAGKMIRVFLAVSLATNGLLLVKILYDTACCVPSLSSSVRTPSSPSASNPPSHLEKPPIVIQNKTNLENRPLVFVGGVPRSGTTLARAMLDAHPDIRCGEETRVLPRIVAMRSKWDRSEREHQRLLEAGLPGDVLDKATRAFVTTIIEGHGDPAKYLCNKDPLLLNYMTDLRRIYPKSKFLLMVRDGRAVAYSIVSRNVTITGVDSKNYMSAALFWNKVVTRMTTDCRLLGSQHCMQVFYEHLVANPKEWMEKILEFLTIPWHDNVLRHHELINSEVSLSK